MNRIFPWLLAVAVAALASPASALAAPPAIEAESLARLTPTDATLEARIDTGGLETTYRFELWASPCSSHGSGCELMMNVPLPSGKLLGSFVGQSVSLDLNSAGVTLTPGGEYGYSVTATNSSGSAEGAWHEFEAPTHSPPSIDGESATNVTEHDATLNAEIDPNGAEAVYEFQIDTNSSYDYTRPACPLAVPGYGACEAIIVGEPLPPGLVEPRPESIPAGNGDQAVSLDLASIGATLRPGTTYHYRVIAANGTAIVTGPDQTFTTPGAVATPAAASSGGGQDGAVEGGTASEPPAVSALRPPPHRKRRRPRRHRRASASHARIDRAHRA